MMDPIWDPQDLSEVQCINRLQAFEMPGLAGPVAQLLVATAGMQRPSDGDQVCAERIVLLKATPLMAKATPLMAFDSSIVEELCFGHRLILAGENTASLWGTVLLRNQHQQPALRDVAGSWRYSMGIKANAATWKQALLAAARAGLKEPMALHDMLWKRQEALRSAGHEYCDPNFTGQTSSPSKARRNIIKPEKAFVPDEQDLRDMKSANWTKPAFPTRKDKIDLGKLLADEIPS